MKAADQHIHADETAALLIADCGAEKNGPDKANGRYLFRPDQGLSCYETEQNICEYNGDHHHEGKAGDQLQNV